MTRVPAAEDAVAAPAGRRGVRNPLSPADRIQAALFDLDGTLYQQSPIRSLMAFELMALFVSAPFQAHRRVRALRAYRTAHERLRLMSCEGSIAAAQLAAAAAEAGLPPDEVRRIVDEWMLTRPLKYLRAARAAGISKLLRLLDRAGVRVGILSDYPADSKLRALGLSGRFSPVLCSTDPHIGALKPSPRGFLRACELWNLSPREVLMIGDRPEVDAAGAIAAGMSCVIIGRPHSLAPKAAGYMVLPSFERLRRALDDV